MKAARKAVEDGQFVSGAARDYGIPKTWMVGLIHGAKKKKEAEEKEQKKKEREEKKREEEWEWKAEEKTRKAKEREEEVRKVEKKARKAEEKSRKAAESTKKARIGMKRKAKPDGVNSSNTKSETLPPPKAAWMQAMHQVDNIDDGECCMCFTTYEEDIRDQSGKEWVQCACGRWLHKDCVLDNDGKERLCPFCLDILS